MKELICTYRVNLQPQSEEDAELLASEFKVNQPVRVKVYKIKPVIEPSIAQNNLMHSCFQLVADNNDDPKLQTKAQVKFATKVALDFRHQDRVAIRPDGMVVFEYRSFSFKNLLDMERLNVFQRAFEFLAGIIGTDVDTMIDEAKQRMQRR